MNRTWNHTVKHSTKIAGAVVISAALLTGCSSQPPADATANTAEAQLKTVRAAPIEKRKISEPMEQVADVISSIQMDIVTKAGGDVKEILKKNAATW